MARIGFLSLPSPGHLTPLIALAAELKQRGHEAILFNVPDVAEKAHQSQLPFRSIASDSYPLGTLAVYMETLGRLDGLAAMAYTNDNLCRRARAICSEAAPVLAEAGLDLLVIDQADMASSSLAAGLRIPFVTVTLALMVNYEESVPGWYPEPYSEDPALRERNRKWQAGFMQIFGPYLKIINEYRAQWQLAEAAVFDELWSSLAQISQQPEQFEFPRRHLPACFHFTGPFSKPDSRTHVPFPYDWLDGRPLVYASFGTIQNRYLHLFQAVAEACRNLDVQLVLSLGGGADPKALGDLPPNSLAVAFAPQLDLLERASLMVTHAGMNSALECLRAGVPMVAIPITNDQPAVAARIAWTGTGAVVPLAACEPVHLSQTIAAVLSNGKIRQSAQHFRDIIQAERGLERAADIVEQIIRTKQPVLRAASAASGV